MKRRTGCTIQKAFKYPRKYVAKIYTERGRSDGGPSCFLTARLVHGCVVQVAARRRQANPPGLSKKRAVDHPPRQCKSIQASSFLVSERHTICQKCRCATLCCLSSMHLLGSYLRLSFWSPSLYNSNHLP